MLRVTSVTVGIFVAACTGVIGPTAQDDGGAGEPDAEVCDPSVNAAPVAPLIETPAGTPAPVVPSELAVRTSGFSDPDGDGHGATQVEIWSLAAGAPVSRLWSAEVTDPARLLQVALADGQFDAGATALEEWTVYGVRARHRDADATCQAWSAWSAYTAFRTDDGSAYLFDDTQILDYHLTIPPASWDAINAEAIPPGCVPHQRDYYAGTLTFQGQTFDGVGVHVKGGCGSARDLNGKPGIKINLEWDDPAVPGCPVERRLYGEKHFTFNNNVQDASFSHERLAYPLYNALGVPEPRTAPMRLYVNGQYYGVYLHVETLDRRFLARHFDRPDGMLYEGTYWCDLVPGNVPPGLDDSYCLTREFAPDSCDTIDPGADPQDYELLRQLVSQIDALPVGGYYPEVTAFFDFDRFFTTWAIESVISHWDAYEFSIMNNYRVYHDPETGLWSVISSGIDQTFGGDQDPWGVSGVLAWKCLQEADCEAAFAARLHEVTDYFEAQGLATRSQQIHDQIATDVYADPRKEFGNGTFDQATIDTQGYINARPARVREILSSRGY